MEKWQEIERETRCALRELPHVSNIQIRGDFFYFKIPEAIKRRIPKTLLLEEMEEGSLRISKTNAREQLSSLKKKMSSFYFNEDGELCHT